MDYVVIAERWVHGDVDAEHVVATFATRADAESWLGSTAANAARALGPGTEGVTLRIEERATPIDRGSRPRHSADDAAKRSLAVHVGSCLCGTVRYEIRGELGAILYCHCSMCRKSQGTAFATNAPVNAAEFEFVSGADAVTTFESSSGKSRVFCSRCGAPIFSRRADRPDVLRVRIGTLDSKIDARPTGHIYAASKAEWFEIRDELPQYEGREPGR